MRIDPAIPDDDFIRALQRVKEKNGALWSVPFVLGRVFSGNAAIYAIRDSDSHIAWMVVERIDQGRGPWMNVWILEGEGLEHAEAIFPLLDDLAKSMGASRWRCEGRKGWGKWLKPVATVFERECT